MIRNQHGQSEHDTRHAVGHHRDCIDPCAHTAPVAAFERERQPKTEDGPEDGHAEADFKARCQRIEVA